MTMADKDDVLETLRVLKKELSSVEGQSDQSPEMTKNACSVLASAMEHMFEIMEQENERRSSNEVSAEFASNVNTKLLSLEKQNEDLAKAIMLLNKNYSNLSMMNETMRNDMHREMVTTQQEFDELKTDFEALKATIFSEMNSHLNEAVIPSLSKNIRALILNDLKSMYSATVQPDRFERLYQTVCKGFFHFVDSMCKGIILKSNLLEHTFLHRECRSSEVASSPAR